MSAGAPNGDDDCSTSISGFFSAALLTQPDDEYNGYNQHQHDSVLNHSTTESVTANGDGDDAHPQGMGHDDDDDGNSDGSDDETDDDADDSDEEEDDDDDNDDQQDDQPEMSLMEIRAIKMKRNRAFLESLLPPSRSGTTTLLGGVVDNKTKKKRGGGNDENDAKNDANKKDAAIPRRGMLLPVSLRLNRRPDTVSSLSAKDAAVVSPPDKLSTQTQTTVSSFQQSLNDHGHKDEYDGEELFDALYDKYPYRDSQIRQLLGILAPIKCGHGVSTTTAAPAPIIVSGQEGTGKTSIVRDILTALSLNHQNSRRSGEEETPMLATAYVNCNTLDVPSSMEELANSAYKQFESQLYVHNKNKTRGQKRKKKVKQNDPNTNGNTTKKVKLSIGSATNTDASSNARKTRSARMRGDINQQQQKFKIDGHDMTRNEITKTTAAMSQSSTVASSLTAVYRFGRSIRALFNHHNKQQQKSQRRHLRNMAGAGSKSNPGHANYSKHCGNYRCGGILVVDHAERMLSFLANNKTEGGGRCNLLGQLLILPRTLGINLTVIAITNSTLLEHSRLNTPISSVNAAAQPICIRFPSYKGKHVMKKVLQQPHLLRLIVGDDSIDKIVGVHSKSSFEHRIVDAFLDTLVQSLLSTTLDVRDIVRIGRTLYAKYIEPLNPANSQKTIEAAYKASTLSVPNAGSSITGIDDESLQKEIISILGAKMLPALRQELGDGLWSLGNRSKANGRKQKIHDLPMLVKYMLIAAFICQVNHADRDRQLFSIQKNGRKRKQKTSNDDEDVAFGGQASAAMDQPKIFRPKTFPLERMLSVYVSLVGLMNNNHSFLPGEERLRSLGGSAFSGSISLLCDMGLLHEQPARTSPSECIRLHEPRYWSPLTIEDAQAISESLGIVLDKYILR